MSRFRKPIKADAILWDFDGTLANSAAKNIAITKQILARVAPRLTGENLPRYLKTEDDYHVANHGAGHWRELYRDYFGMTANEIETAGPLWETYQLLDKTNIGLFDGVADTVNYLSCLPQGICSANATRLIRQVLETHRINSVFHSVIGYENLPDEQQKPAPEGGLRCLQEIFGHTEGKTIVFVGDHVADVKFARGLAKELDSSNTVISMIVTHSGANPNCWEEAPDEVLNSPAELTKRIRF